MNITLRFEKIVPSGQALAHYEGKAWFCMGALPGELCEVRVLRETPTYGLAELVAVAEASSRRSSDDLAPMYAPWKDVDYEYQVELKTQILQELFAKPKVNLAVSGVASSPETEQYRNKLAFNLLEADGRLILGMHQRGSKTIIATPDGCSLGHPDLNRYALAVLERINASAVAEVAQELIVRRSGAGDVVAVLVLKTRKRFDFQSLRAPGLSGLVVRADGVTIWSGGESTLVDTIGGITLASPAAEFMQVNIPAFEQALGAIINEVTHSERVLDLYGGAGTIGIPVAAQTGAAVIGVEVNAASVELAKANARANDINTYKCTVASADALPDTLFDGISTVIVDPPRSGLHPELVDQLLRLMPAKIIYLSCDPATQARDTEKLLLSYTASTVSGFDFYPQTPHLESLIVFSA